MGPILGRISILRPPDEFATRTLVARVARGPGACVGVCVRAFASVCVCESVGWYGFASVVVDGHLRLRAPYPVRFAKLSSLKLG